jgi:hypothetical protein
VFLCCNQFRADLLSYPNWRVEARNSVATLFRVGHLGFSLLLSRHGWIKVPPFLAPLVAAGMARIAARARRTGRFRGWPLVV